MSSAKRVMDLRRSKPTGPDFSHNARELIATIKSMAQLKVVRRRPRPRAALALPPLSGRSERPRVLTIAASTGGDHFERPALAN